MRWRQTRRDSEDDGASPPNVRRSPRLQRVEEEAIAGPSTPAAPPPPPTEPEGSERDRKKGKPFKVREEEYKKTKEAERRQVEEGAARRDLDRAERARRREEKAKQKELGRRYGFEPDL